MLKVLEPTRHLAGENNITSLYGYIWKQALRVGNRTIMMHEGKIILDLKGAQREKMTVPGLVEMFHSVSGEQMQMDRILLS